MKLTTIILGLSLLLNLSTLYAEEKKIESIKLQSGPIIDGEIDDVWLNSPKVITHDKIANIDIQIQSSYTDTHIYFLIHFPDNTENRIHKTLTWNPDLELYKVGYEREDTFIFKWSMEAIPIDLSLSSETPYKADIWYWKSHRTDHAGYADDKYQIFSQVQTRQSQPLISKSGKTFYLTRRGDNGSSAYKSLLQSEYQKEQMPSFKLRQPTGSRADVKAKGKWRDGYWNIEFSRRLTTGQRDDIPLNPKQTYQLGVSRYEIAGRRPNQKIEQPNFGSGDISEPLRLTFKQQTFYD